jgi:hypothetical protein
MSKEKMISIWMWVGIVLLIYGVIITGCGIYYAATGLPPAKAPALEGSNPSLWWGIIMLVFGAIFAFIGYKAGGEDV